MADSNGRCGAGGGQPWDDTFNGQSNYGSIIDLAAPGVRILSTLPNNQYGLLSGTSMSTPHVTGAVALYLSLHPTATPEEVVESLKTTGTKPANFPQQPFPIGCDGNGRGYFSFQGDGDNIREPLLYLGWGSSVCPTDCPVYEPSLVDSDEDNVVDSQDNCELILNSDQKDTDNDGTGDVCDVDLDGDQRPNYSDNCESVPNSDQKDTDGDTRGDACDRVRGPGY